MIVWTRDWLISKQCTYPVIRNREASRSPELYETPAQDEQENMTWSGGNPPHRFIIHKQPVEGINHGQELLRLVVP